jgi:acetyl esterase/lipase
MASEQLNKVIERIKSQPQNPGASIEKRRAGMERISEHVASDVSCEPVTAGGVPAEWIAAPGAVQDRVILYLHGGGYVIGSINTHRLSIRFPRRLMMPLRHTSGCSQRATSLARSLSPVIPRAGD